MDTLLPNRFYRRVPQDQKQLLEDFRRNHPYHTLDVDGSTWRYMQGGQGVEILLLLPAGIGIGDGSFLHIPLFEQTYRVIIPEYPPIGKVEQLVAGLLAIVEAEAAQTVHVFGHASGGMLAQVLVRERPDLVKKLILSHTTTTSPPVPEEAAYARRKSLNRFLRVLMTGPLWMVRQIFNRQIVRLLSVLPAHEKRFWKAFFNESLDQTQQPELVANYDTMLDFLENQSFAVQDLKNWQGSVLILDSQNDPAFDPAEKQALRQLYPRAQEYTFPGEGHLISILHRESFPEVILGFLNSPTETSEFSV